MDKTEHDPELFYQVNAELVSRISKAHYQIRDTSWKGQDLIHVGSALEYGNIGGELSESSIPNPTTLYGKSKLAGTRALRQFCTSHGLKAITARLFTVYGPGEHPDRLLPLLLKTAHTGEFLKLTAGEQKRDFTYVADVALGLILLAISSTTPGSVINLCSGNLKSVRHFVEIAATALGINRDLLSFGALPAREEEMQNTDVSIKRLRRLTGWIPTTSIKEGILRTKSFIESERF